MKKIALITGGTSGIGLEAAKKLAEKDLDLYLVYKSDHQKAQDAKDYFNRQFPNLKVFASSFDLSQIEGIDKFLSDFNKIVSEYRLDVIISSHGRSHPHLFLQKTKASIIETITEHLISNIMILHNLLPKLCVQSFGRVVFMTSLASEKINRGQADYALSKGALETFVQSMVSEYGHRNITFNCISSGFADTHFTKDIYKNLSEKHKKIVVPKLQIAELISLLTDEKNTHINGSTFRIDGGQFCLNNNFEYHTLSFHKGNASDA